MKITIIQYDTELKMKSGIITIRVYNILTCVEFVNHTRNILGGGVVVG